MNNYLANIAARTVNPDELVRPRLTGLFEPPPVLREPSLDGRAIDRLRAEPPSPIDADIDSTTIAKTDRRRRGDARHERALKVKPQPALLDAPIRDMDVAVTSMSPTDQISFPPPTTIRAPGNRTVAKMDSYPRTTHFEERPAEAQTNPAPIETSKATALESRQMLRVESRFDEPARRPVAHHTNAVKDEQVSAGADRSRKIATPSLNVREHDQDLVRPLRRARPAVEREFETVIIREKRIVDRSGLGNESTPKPEAAKAPGISDARERTGKKVVPAAVQPLIAPKVPVVPERTPLNRPDAEAQPTVHVTIGRIEIRAIQSPQPAVKSRGTTPVMNLDDYLRRRNQGGAR